MPENDREPSHTAPWPRRRFLGAAAAAGVGAALGPSAAVAAPAAAPPEPPPAAPPAPRATFDIHGSPRPSWSPHSTGIDRGRFTPEQSRLIGSHLGIDARDRLLLGLG